MHLGLTLHPCPDLLLWLDEHVQAARMLLRRRLFPVQNGMQRSAKLQTVTMHSAVLLPESAVLLAQKPQAAKLVSHWRTGQKRLQNVNTSVCAADSQSAQAT